MAKRTITISAPDTAACPEATCASSLKGCTQCDGFILIPINPALLIEGALYLEGTILTGPDAEAGINNWVVEIEDSLLSDPFAAFSQCDYRVCCNDCHARFAKVLYDDILARLAAL
jgi:hypothetical protein